MYMYMYIILLEFCVFTFFVCFLQEMIEQNVAWNDDIGEWQLRCVAYSGNNMRKQSPQPDKDKDKVRQYGVELYGNMWCEMMI